MDEKQVEDSSFVEEGHTAVAKAPDGGLNVRQALSVWRKGVAWSVVLSLAVMMESYNTILLVSAHSASFAFTRSSSLPPLAELALRRAAFPERLRHEAQVWQVPDPVRMAGEGLF